MNVYRLLHRRAGSGMSPERWVTIPGAMRRATGLVPGRPVVVGLNDRGEVVPTRTQAERPGEARAARIDRALDAVGDRFSSGQSTVEIMEELRGPREG